MTPADNHPLPVHSLVALCVLNHAVLSGARVTLALHALQLGVSPSELGLMLAPFALASALAALPLGRWVDRAGARVPALAGMALMTLALVACTALPGLAVLAGAAAAIGVGYTASLIALQSELARERGERELAAGFAGFAIGTAASGGLGPILAGQCLTHGGVNVAFGVLAFLSFSAGCASALRAHRLLGRRRGLSIERPALLSRAALTGLGGLKRLMLADLLMSFAWNANGFVVPLIGQRLAWSADTVGNLLGCFGIAVMLVRARPSTSHARGSHWRAIVRALVISGVVVALLPVATAMPGPYVLEVLFGWGLGGALPSVLSLVEQHTPGGRRAEVLGLRQAVLGIGATTLPSALGALVAASGLVVGLVGYGVALLVAGATIAPRRSGLTSHRPDDRH